MTEAEFLALIRPLATHAAARGFGDDAAVLASAPGDLVLTHDVLVAGVHFLPDDPPGDVAWKLVAVNLSDLAAKGAVPIGVLLGYPLGDDAWDRAFVAGLVDVLARFDVALLGGDTVRGPRVLSMTAIGRTTAAPSRSGAQAGDVLYLTGPVGLAGLGLAVLQGEVVDCALDHGALIAAYRRPTPRLAQGRALAPSAHAMMDVSDGLLIDATRMADASGLALAIDLDAVPHAGERTRAVTAGDDYELLVAAPAGLDLGVPLFAIGRFAPGRWLTLRDRTGPVALPTRLGWTHDGSV